MLLVVGIGYTHHLPHTYNPVGTHCTYHPAGPTYSDYAVFGYPP